MAKPTQDEDQLLRKAEEMQRLMDEPLIQEAFQNLKDVWGHAAAFGTDEECEKARMLIKVLGKIEDELRHVIDNGKIVMKMVADREYQDGLMHESERA